ncbi:MAG: hypothetical protein GTN62_07440 [Gemmatimonadales bacterium]|nr:hypothetical protein [Gemmatimonadales bacterium]NIP07397.1 hypothetical protein [Gemmatimonadales bacterium]NIQ99094.1 hypothetical protein [Gemmatimonadales bacterium]NIS63887.1 hypothetical protein [Gemmatimonadales bacterium]
MRAPLAQSLRAAAVLLALAGVALWVFPARVATPDVPPVTIPVAYRAPDASQQAAALLSYEEIVRSNVLASDRSPPAARYVPPGLASEVPRSTTPTAPQLRLYGVASGPTGAVALIDADPAIPGAEIYRPGDRISTYRLDTIADTFVVLMGASGRRVLRLEAQERRAP